MVELLLVHGATVDIEAQDAEGNWQTPEQVLLCFILLFLIQYLKILNNMSFFFFFLKNTKQM